MGHVGDGWIMETMCTIEVAHMFGIQWETLGILKKNIYNYMEKLDIWNCRSGWFQVQCNELLWLWAIFIYVERLCIWNCESGL